MGHAARTAIGRTMPERHATLHPSLLVPHPTPSTTTTATRSRSWRQPMVRAHLVAPVASWATELAVAPRARLHHARRVRGHLLPSDHPGSRRRDPHPPAPLRNPGRFALTRGSAPWSCFRGPKRRLAAPAQSLGSPTSSSRPVASLSAPTGFHRSGSTRCSPDARRPHRGLGPGFRRRPRGRAGTGRRRGRPP